MIVVTGNEHNAILYSFEIICNNKIYILNYSKIYN